MSKLGYIHSTESFGAVDGPGVRFVVFMQGCKMRCKYCHNPDTWNMQGISQVANAQHFSKAVTERDTSKAATKQDIPQAATEHDPSKTATKQDIAKTATAQELINQALRYKEYWGKDGGITISGGEPLLQIEFITELLELAKTRSIHTAIDTSGQPFAEINEQVFDELCEVCDLFIVDMKHLVAESHKKLTGHDNKPVKQMIAYLDSKNKPMWVRHVLVPGVTDDTQHLSDLAAYLDQFQSIQKREILPYHTLGVDKWNQLGLDYKLKNTPPPTETQIAKAKNIFER